MRLTLRRAAFWALGIAGMVVALPQSSHGEEEWPGLPESDGTFGNIWMNAAQGGVSYASRAKQWVRSPDGMVTFTATVGGRRTEGDCNSRCVKYFRAGGQAFIVSPEGAPAPYGYLAPMTVRSVGFGLMPVEATVQVSQRRENGYPIPFVSWLSGEDHFDKSVAADAVYQVGNPVGVKDSVNVQILKVLVDGVDLGLTGSCQTVTPPPMTMPSQRYTIPLPFENPTTIPEWFRRADPSSFFNPEWGGTLSGSITIPPFTGCTTASGDDLSDLMTLSVSGPDNPVSARIGWRCAVSDGLGGVRPLTMGEDTPKSASAATADQADDSAGGSSKCDYGTQKFDYPTRGTD